MPTRLTFFHRSTTRLIERVEHVLLFVYIVAVVVMRFKHRRSAAERLAFANWADAVEINTNEQPLAFRRARPFVYDAPQTYTHTHLVGLRHFTPHGV